MLWFGLAWFVVAALEFALIVYDLVTRDEALHSSSVLMCVVFGIGGIVFLVLRRRDER